MAAPKFIEARKAAAMESLAERLAAIEEFITGGKPLERATFATSEIEPIGPKLDALRDEIAAEIKAAKAGTADLLADRFAAFDARLDDLAKAISAAATPNDKVWPAAKPAKNA